MNAKNLKQKIHFELFERPMQDDISTGTWNTVSKQRVIQRSVKIMKSHGFTESEIVDMLMNKFGLSNDEANEFIKEI